MQINGPSHVHGSQAINAPHRASSAQPADQSNSIFGMDQLDISHEADMVSQVSDLPDIRSDRVAEIRAAIASGVYETPEKLDVAVDRLLDEIGAY